VTCWSCQGATAPGTPTCGACGKLQPPPSGQDHFATLGLPRRFALAPAELEQRLRDLSRQFHPDRFARAEPRERRIALERATGLNDAGRVLRDWRRRAAALLALSGHDPASGDLHDHEFLEEQLAWREGLALARADGDGAALAELAARGRARLATLEAEVGRLFEAGDWAGGSAREIARRLARARYYETLVADAERGAAPGGGA
jgi:molecular chaperone HscB